MPNRAFGCSGCGKRAWFPPLARWLSTAALVVTVMAGVLIAKIAGIGKPETVLDFAIVIGWGAVTVIAAVGATRRVCAATADRLVR